jgi:hypothetical protein
MENKASSGGIANRLIAPADVAVWRAILFDIGLFTLRIEPWRVRPLWEPHRSLSSSIFAMTHTRMSRAGTKRSNTGETTDE